MIWWSWQSQSFVLFKKNETCWSLFSARIFFKFLIAKKIPKVWVSHKDADCQHNTPRINGPKSAQHWQHPKFLLIHNQLYLPNFWSSIDNADTDISARNYKFVNCCDDIGKPLPSQLWREAGEMRGIPFLMSMCACAALSASCELATTNRTKALISYRKHWAVWIRIWIHTLQVFWY